MDDLKKRLSDYADYVDQNAYKGLTLGNADVQLFRDAAARISSLERELAEAREACARGAQSEPEMDGEPPSVMHVMPLRDVANAVVRATRNSIAQRIRSLSTKPSDGEAK